LSKEGGWLSKEGGGLRSRGWLGMVGAQVRVAEWYKRPDYFYQVCYLVMCHRGAGIMQGFSACLQMRGPRHMWRPHCRLCVWQCHTTLSIPLRALCGMPVRPPGCRVLRRPPGGGWLGVSCEVADPRANPGWCLAAELPAC
jgi:hypothetical protein